MISHVALGGDPSCCDSVDKSLLVAFVLVGVGGGELGDGLVEHVRASSIRKYVEANSSRKRGTIKPSASTACTAG